MAVRVLILLAALSSPVYAAELLLGVATRHYGPPERWEHNQLLGVRTERVLLIQFENSYRRPGAYVGPYWQTPQPWHVGATVGALSSYCPSNRGAPCVGGWTAGGMAWIGYQSDRWSVRAVAAHAALLVVGFDLR